MAITRSQQAKQLLALGGRIGLQEGGIMPRLNQLGSGVSSAEQTLQDINQRLESAESSLGGGGVEQLQAVRPSGSGELGIFPSSRPENAMGPIAQIPASGGMKLPVFTGTPQSIDPAPFMRPGNIPGTDVPYQTLRGGIPAAGYADGGIMNSNVVGGEFDFESARQMYGLGKLVKKVSKTVKKIAKSPIGKAAIIGGLAYFGGGGGNPFTAAGRGKFSLSNLFSLTKNPLISKGGEFSPMRAIGLASLSPLLFSPEQEEDDEEEQDRGEGLDIARIRANPNQFLARRFVAEGGSMKEPVAKKTMPLLDMGGKEMDLRAEGGFVPIGRMEKADDVPARLSKNEFVFTADAVRNAGDGDVDKGAEVMYNMMKNLESGGDVSKESQGLEGARRMFQTSQRLEEVL